MVGRKVGASGGGSTPRRSTGGGSPHRSPEAQQVEARPAEASMARERSRSNKIPRRCLLPSVGKVKIKSIGLRNIVGTFESKS